MTIQTTRKEAYVLDRLFGYAEDVKAWVVISGDCARFYQQEKAATHHAEKTGGYPIQTRQAIAEQLIEVID